MTAHHEGADRPHPRLVDAAALAAADRQAWPTSIGAEGKRLMLTSGKRASANMFSHRRVTGKQQSPAQRRLNSILNSGRTSLHPPETPGVSTRNGTCREP